VIHAVRCRSLQPFHDSSLLLHQLSKLRPNKFTIGTTNLVFLQAKHALHAPACFWLRSGFAFAKLAAKVSRQKRVFCTQIPNTAKNLSTSKLVENAAD
jgi:hypothetical protein